MKRVGIHVSRVLGNKTSLEFLEGSAKNHAMKDQGEILIESILGDKKR